MCSRTWHWTKGSEKIALHCSFVSRDRGRLKRLLFELAMSRVTWRCAAKWTDARIMRLLTPSDVGREWPEPSPFAVDGFPWYLRRELDDSDIDKVYFTSRTRDTWAHDATSRWGHSSRERVGFDQMVKRWVREWTNTFEALSAKHDIPLGRARF